MLVHRPHSARVAVVMGAVYLVWGSTYLAIGVVVETMPPLTSAGIRFMLAGAILWTFTIRKIPREQRPTAIQWRSAALIGGALLLGGNGGVVLAQDLGVPSGIVALLVGTVPLCMAVIGRLFYKERLPWIATAGVIVGFAGTAILAKPSGAFPVSGSLLVIGAALIWSAGSLYARRAPLPDSPFLKTAMEMMAGGALQVLAGGVRGEWTQIDPAAFTRSSIIAFVYLVLIGSLIGYTAYIWALHNAPISLVSTYAYVNPIIALFLGAVFANEVIHGRDLVAGVLIVGSVALIVSARPGAKTPAQTTPESAPADAPPPGGPTPPTPTTRKRRPTRSTRVS